MITLNDLTPRDEEFIRFVADLQIDNLKSLLTRSSEMDVDLYCHQEGVSPDKINETMKRSLQAFLEVKESPHILLSLDPDNLSIFKHIANKYVSGFKQSKVRIWKKFLFQENYTNVFYKPN